MEFPGNFIGTQNTANTNYLSGVHTLRDVGQGVSDGTWPTNYEIGSSLRFNGTSNYLTRTPSSLGNRRTFTISFWHKKSADDDFPRFQQRIDSNSSQQFTISGYSTLNNFRVLDQDGTGANRCAYHFVGAHRDVGQWMHIVVAIDTTQFVAEDRQKVFVNGVFQPIDDGANSPVKYDRFYETSVNNTSSNRLLIGCQRPNASATLNGFFDGYLAEYYLIDGLQLDASYFGSFHPTKGKWLPEKYTGEFGVNGFYLPFEGTNEFVSTSANKGSIAEDKSGNNNHFSFAGLAQHLVTPDSPTNNFCTFNSQLLSTASLSNGNLTLSGGGNYTGCVSSLAVPPKGHWYMEIRTNDTTSDLMWGGVSARTFKRADLQNGQWSQLPHSVYSTSYGSNINTAYYDGGANQTSLGTVSSPATTIGDVLGYSFDFDNGFIHVSKNGTHMSTFRGWVPGDDYFLFGYQVHSTWPAVNITVNWGQDPTFNDTEGIHYYNRVFPDANGLGKFLYEPPAGALAICSQNIEKISNRPASYEYIFDETNRHQYDSYNGSMRTSQFSPYIKGGYGISFDGTDDIIDSPPGPDTTPANLSLDGAANNDFTIEFWYWFDADPDSSYYAGLFSKWGGDADKEFVVHAYSDRTIRGNIASDASGNYTSFTTDKGLLKGRWNHIAFVGDIATDGDLYCWINGNRVLAKTNFSGYNTSGTKASGMRLGFYASSTYSKSAIFSDFRMVSGLMVYDKTATTIDVPTEPLKNISGGSGTDAYTTALLYSANSSRIVDTGGSSLSTTVTSAPLIVDFSPYTTREPSMSHPAIKAPARDLSITGGSFTTLGGNQGYLFYPDSDDFSMGATDFTLECWIYCIDSGTRRFFWGVGSSGGANADVAYSFEYKTDQTINFYAYTTGGTGYSHTTTATIEENTWNHIAAVRYNNHFTIYINGVDGGDASSTGGTISGLTLINGSNKMSIGTLGEYVSEGHQGYITDLRITKGKAVYTSAFTPPTSPLSALSKTVFLARPYSKLKQSESNYKNNEKYGKEEVGGELKLKDTTGATALYPSVRISDTSPYQKGNQIGSLIFDGIDDSVVLPTISAVGTSDWTLEYWFKELTDISENYSGLVTLSATADAKRIGSAIHSGTLYCLLDASWRDTSFAPTTGKWHHVAIVRDKDTRLSIFVDGFQKLNYTSSIKDVDYTEDFSEANGGLNLIGSYSNFNNILVTDVRFTKQVLYEGSGTNGTLHFTPPRYPLSTDKYVTDGTDQSATGPSTTTTYTVTVASGTKYDGTTGNRYLIDGEPFETVTLHRGSTYRFDVSDSSFGSNAHPFRFSSNENNSPSAAYTTGVTTSGDGGSPNAYVEIVVANDAPDNLYYYCTNHGGMGGTINVQGGRTITSGNALMLIQPGKQDHKNEVIEFASMAKINYIGTSTAIANNGYSVTSTHPSSVHSSFSVSSGKHYVECSGLTAYVGVQEANTASPAPTYNASISGTNSQGIGFWTQAYSIYGGNGTSSISQIIVSADGTESVNPATDVIAMAIDMDSSPKTVAWYVNNTRVFTAKLGSNEYIARNGTTQTATATFADISNLYVTYQGGNTDSRSGDFNFGQDPSILGNVTPSGGTNADGGFPDEDGVGSFRYAPPTGYKAMARIQKPLQIVSDAGQHPENYFQCVTYTGSFPSPATVKTRFKPGLIWIKSRTQTYSHYLYDMIRQENRTFGDLQSDATNVEADGDDIRFDDDGFASIDGQATNEAGQGVDNLVAWVWRGGDNIVTNTSGTVPSLVSANREAGFSIVHYTSENVETNNYTETIGHGLDKRPEVIFCREYTTARNWDVCFTGDAGNMQGIPLNTTGPKFTNGGAKVMVSNSRTFDIGTQISEYNDKPVIFYCWHSVPGYSKIGKYRGNGSTTGTFVYCGFRPAFLMVRSVENGRNWQMLDSVRSPVNPRNNFLRANTNGVEGTNYDVDFYSNGFMLRSTDADYNASDENYMFMAFADTPHNRNSAI